MGFLSLKYVVYSDGLRYMLSVLYVSSIETCKNTQVASVLDKLKLVLRISQLQCANLQSNYSHCMKRTKAHCGQGRCVWIREGRSVQSIIQ